MNFTYLKIFGKSRKQAYILEYFTQILITVFIGAHIKSKG